MMLTGCCTDLATMWPRSERDWCFGGVKRCDGSRRTDKAVVYFERTVDWLARSRDAAFPLVFDEIGGISATQQHVTQSRMDSVEVRVRVRATSAFNAC